MGKTFRRNDRFKKDRRDKNFKNSKKFKEFKKGGYSPPKPFEELPPGNSLAILDEDETI
jgi:hypothetical protein